MDDVSVCPDVSARVGERDLDVANTHWNILSVSVGSALQVGRVHITSGPAYR